MTRKEIKEKSKLTTAEWQNWAINSIWEMQPAKAKSEGYSVVIVDTAGRVDQFYQRYKSRKK